jgi:predicted ribosomally synthesized peptide with SipW-like signal peptide
MSRHAAVKVRRAGTTSRRLRAILAGGLVLGVGAAVTLAAWNDGEYAQAQFSAGVFGIEGNANGTTYADHPSGDPAALVFAPALTAMVPGTVTYSLFSIKTITNSVPGGVQITAAAANNAAGTLGPYLRYQVRTIASTTCTESTFNGGTTILAASTLAVNPAGPQAIAGNSGTVHYCFRFELPSGADNDAQGKSVTAKWTFTATAS